MDDKRQCHKYDDICTLPILQTVALIWSLIGFWHDTILIRLRVYYRYIDGKTQLAFYIWDILVEYN